MSPSYGVVIHGNTGSALIIRVRHGQELILRMPIHVQKDAFPKIIGWAIRDCDFAIKVNRHDGVALIKIRL